MGWPFWKHQPVDPISGQLNFKDASDLDGRFNEAFLASTIARLTQQATIATISLPGEEWQVKYQGSLWRARSRGGKLHLTPGDEVLVVARQGNVLFVEGSSAGL